MGHGLHNGRTAIVTTPGNQRGHLILRGGSTPNYELEHLISASESLHRAGISAGLVIDCSHANSGKDPLNQAAVLRSLNQSRGLHNAPVAGVMIESFLEDGRQDYEAGKPLVPGLSITDGCVGWEKTREMLLSAADSLRKHQKLESFT